LKILVCMKQVPQKDAPLKLNETGTWIREDVSYEVNEPDAYALEEALRQKEKHTGEVVVITSGPARAQQVLREALAKGADRAIHLEDERSSASMPSTPPKRSPQPSKTKSSI
jgi:electron transfer flavoprotein beta subunit